MFHGAFESAIYWNRSEPEPDEVFSKEGLWQLYTFRTNKTWAQMITQDMTKYPLGKNTWQIARDTCAQKMDREAILTLTVCQQGSHSYSYLFSFFFLRGCRFPGFRGEEKLMQKKKRKEIRMV